MNWTFWDYAFVPLFLLGVFLAKALPEWIAWKLEERRMKRLFAKRCLECNYDLRACDNRRDCPECGTKIPRKRY